MLEVNKHVVPDTLDCFDRHSLDVSLDRATNTAPSLQISNIYYPQNNSVNQMLNSLMII